MTEHPDYNAPAALKAFMEQHGMAMQKKFGQNFMVNPAARTRIAGLLELDSGARVWEIGPGLGCMTDEMLRSGADVTAFEIDRGFIALLGQFFEDYARQDRFRIVEGDVLRTWRHELERQPEIPAADIRLFGNLPYNIAATFIADTITRNLTFARCVFTVQKEVAQRMAAAPSTEQYSAFSVLCQWLYDVKLSMELAPGNFWPRPKVSSQAVLLTPKQHPARCTMPPLFVKTVHALFSQRRKTLLNNIKPLLPKGSDADGIFRQAGLDKSERAENLCVAQFVALTEALHEAAQSAKP